MPSTSLETYAAWSNYHLTVGQSPEEGLPAAMTVEHMRRMHCSDVDQTNPIKTMSDTAGMLMHVLKETAQDTTSRFGDRSPDTLAAGIVGRGWSFAPLIGTPFAQIMAEGLAWIANLHEDDRHEDSKNIDLCMCGGGTRLRELVSWAETRKCPLSIATSGTHLGPTVAGTFGTASHGSRLGFGGFQDIVRGMHIVTADNRHVWLHKPGARVLNKTAIKNLAATYHYSTLGDLCENKQAERHFAAVDCVEIDEGDDFENALVHLGCMGIVNAVAVELIPIEGLAVMAWKAPLPQDWLKWIGNGEFQKLADHFGADGLKPEFYELTIDPFMPFCKQAAHLFYFKDDDKDNRAKIAGQRTTPGDVASSAIGQSLFDLANFSGNGIFPGLPEIPSDALHSSNPAIAQMLAFLLQCQTSLMDAYLKSGGFKTPALPFSLNDAIATGSWGEIHRDEISGGKPGALYNAAYAIDRCDAPKAVAAISAAVKGLAPSFVFTLRFVDYPAGNLAFTRFQHNAVIEIDGLSPFVCKQTLRYGREKAVFDVFQQAALEALASTVERGAIAVKQALSKAGIEYSMHWAKLGDLDKEKVAEDFGNGGKKPAIDSWRETRMKLVTPKSDKFFRNPAALKYGLLQPFCPPKAEPCECD